MGLSKMVAKGGKFNFWNTIEHFYFLFHTEHKAKNRRAASLKDNRAEAEKRHKSQRFVN